MARLQPKEESRVSTYQRWQIVVVIDDEYSLWPLLTVVEISPDGVLNLRTTHRRQRSWLDRFKQHDNIVKREELG
ncbi:hypothetical protein BH24CHL4_BH24CHL4_23720 [soil metagenome]